MYYYSVLPTAHIHVVLLLVDGRKWKLMHFTNCLNWIPQSAGYDFLHILSLLKGSPCRKCTFHDNLFFPNECLCAYGDLLKGQLCISL